MLCDAHIHLAALLEADPDFPGRLCGDWGFCASSHDEAELARSETILALLASRHKARRGQDSPDGGPPRRLFVSSFGIHPQAPTWDHAALLESLAARKKIAAIGEAGFDFFGDEPGRVRDGKNERVQRAIFEYQLGLAEKHGLALLLHIRKAMDLVYEYAPRLRGLRAAIFHSYSGTERDVESILARRIPAYFSFGTPLLKGNKRAARACAALPADSLLIETDAPWQPLRGVGFSRPEDLRLVLRAAAEIRGLAAESLESLTEKNFRSAYALPAAE